MDLVKLMCFKLVFFHGQQGSNDSGYKKPLMVGESLVKYPRLLRFLNNVNASNDDGINR